MRKFKCVRAWARHSVGEVIVESEYNKLPHELKVAGSFVEVVDEIPVRPLTVEEVKLEEQSVQETKEVVAAIVVEEPDALVSAVIDPFATKRKKYEHTT